MKKILFLIFVGVWAILAATAVSAATFTYNLNIEFTGGDEPGGVPPWLTAVISDDGVDNGYNIVRISMSTPGLIDNEFVGGWWFNMDFAVDDLRWGGDGPVVYDPSTDLPQAEGITLNPDGLHAGGGARGPAVRPLPRGLGDPLAGAPAGGVPRSHRSRPDVRRPHPAGAELLPRKSHRPFGQPELDAEQPLRDGRPHDGRESR